MVVATYMSDAGNRRSDRDTGDRMATISDSIAQQVFIWKPEGIREKRKTENTWRHDLEADAKETQ